MKTIIVASKNPVKIDAALQGFQEMFPEEEFSIEGVDVESGVADQPMTDKETLQGAQNRAENAQKEMPGADFWVGLEGGVDFYNEKMAASAWMYVLSREGKVGTGKTGIFFLPPKITELISQGYEMGVANDMVFNDENSKQKGGGVSFLTHGIIDRKRYYTEAIIFALIPFKNTDLY